MKHKRFTNFVYIGIVRYIGPWMADISVSASKKSYQSISTSDCCVIAYVALKQKKLVTPVRQHRCLYKMIHRLLCCYYCKFLETLGLILAKLQNRNTASMRPKKLCPPETNLWRF